MIRTLLADTITPLIGTSFLYLVIANAIIGIIEGRLLRRWFAARRTAAWWMIAANYLSAWIGWFILLFLIADKSRAFLGPRPIERVNLFAAALVGVSFLITIIIESGFVFLTMDSQKRTLPKTLFATICVNLVSYVLVCAMFLWFCYTLPFNAHVTNLADIGPISHGTIYWINPAGQIMSAGPSHPDAAHVVRQLPQLKMQGNIQAIYFIVLRNSPTLNRVELDVRRSDDEELTPVVSDVGPSSMLPSDFWDQFEWPNRLYDLRPRPRRQTQIFFSWYAQTLTTHVPGGPSSRIYIALPMLDGRIDHPSVLPDDKIIFEWDGQILIFDPHTRKLAFIAFGAQPVFAPQ